MTETEGPDAGTEQQQDQHAQVLEEGLDGIEIHQLAEAVAIVVVAFDGQDRQEQREPCKHRQAAPEGQPGIEIGEQQQPQDVLGHDDQTGQQESRPERKPSEAEEIDLKSVDADEFRGGREQKKYSEQGPEYILELVVNNQS